ncbi:MAG: Uma2 family endonuclease [Vicinamibacterales bacterium]
MDGTPQMPSSPASDTRLTVDDLLLWPDDGKRHELIDGVHYVSASPSTRHQAISGRLFLSLGNFFVAHPALGRVFYAPCDVVFTRWDLVVPDLLVIAADQLDILTAKNIQGPPAIVIEILSPSTRKVDEQIKRRLFERGDVREYWVADPELDLIKVYRRAADGGFPRVAELTREGGDTLTTPLLPGWSLALDAIFTDAL